MDISSWVRDKLKIVDLVYRGFLVAFVGPSHADLTLRGLLLSRPVRYPLKPPPPPLLFSHSSSPSQDFPFRLHSILASTFPFSHLSLVSFHSPAVFLTVLWSSLHTLRPVQYRANPMPLLPPSWRKPSHSLSFWVSLHGSAGSVKSEGETKATRLEREQRIPTLFSLQSASFPSFLLRFFCVLLLSVLVFLSSARPHFLLGPFFLGDFGSGEKTSVLDWRVPSN